MVKIILNPQNPTTLFQPRVSQNSISISMANLYNLQSKLVRFDKIQLIRFKSKTLDQTLKTHLCPSFSRASSCSKKLALHSKAFPGFFSKSRAWKRYLQREEEREERGFSCVFTSRETGWCFLFYKSCESCNEASQTQLFTLSKTVLRTGKEICVPEHGHLVLVLIRPERWIFRFSTVFRYSANQYQYTVYQ